MGNNLQIMETQFKNQISTPSQAAIPLKKWYQRKSILWIIGLTVIVIAGSAIYVVLNRGVLNFADNGSTEQYPPEKIIADQPSVMKFTAPSTTPTTAPTSGPETYYYDQKTYNDGVVIKNGEQNSRYEYKNTVLSAERVGQVADVYFIKDGKSEKIINDVIIDIPGGGFTEFKKTKDPNIALLYTGTGDAGFYMVESYYIILSSKQIMQVYYNNTPEIEVKDINGITSKLGFIVDTSKCKGNNGNTYLNGMSVNGKLTYTFPKPIVLGCVDPNDGIYLPGYEFKVNGVDVALSKIFFTVTYYTGSQPNLTSHELNYVFSIDNQSIQESFTQEYLYTEPKQ